MSTGQVVGLFGHSEMAENSASGDSSGKGCVTNPASSNDTTSSENVQEIEIKPKFSYYERDLKVLSHLPWAYGCVVKGTKFNGESAKNSIQSINSIKF